ncbi:MAG: hypothetical protein E7317_07065 [Clostridiales bacterium]|nr:hypothetical protein [Clostridiales bacterium]
MKRAVAFILMILVITTALTAALAENSDEELAARFAGQTLEYNGKTYKARNRLETMLLIGTDERENPVYDDDTFTYAQADFLMLMVIDDDDKIITPIRINRDTMTTITAYSQFHTNPRDAVAQIALAFAMGEDFEEGAELTCKAVSGMFDGASVDHYYVLNMDGIPALNDSIGGVTLTLNEDFTSFDPTMVKGETMTLKGEQAYMFLRYRFGVGDESNVSRMERQKIYMDAAKPILVSRLENNPNSFGDLYESLQDYATTDMSKGRIINLAAKVQRYEVLDSLAIEGESKIGLNDYMEFRPDESSLMEVLLKVFYKET